MTSTARVQGAVGFFCTQKRVLHSIVVFVKLMANNLLLLYRNILIQKDILIQKILQKRNNVKKVQKNLKK